MKKKKVVLEKDIVEVDDGKSDSVAPEKEVSNRDDKADSGKRERVKGNETMEIEQIPVKKY